MPRDLRPSEMGRALTEQERRRVYALWHRNEPPARVVVDKFARKLKRYGMDKRQRPVEWANFSDTSRAGDALAPDPKRDLEQAKAYVRRQLDNIDDVVVFYSDLLGDPEDEVGRLTGSELEFVFGEDMRSRLRFWFGGVHSINLELAQIGPCQLRLVPWNRLPPGGSVFNWADPDGKLDAEVGTSVEVLLGDGIGAEGAAPAPELPPDPARAQPPDPAPTQPPGPAPAPSPSPGGGWLGRLFGRKG